MTQGRPFTFVAAIIFLLIAGVHLYRLAVGLDITIGASAVPMTVSWIGLVIAALLSVMLFKESRG